MEQEAVQIPKEKGDPPKLNASFIPTTSFMNSSQGKEMREEPHTPEPPVAAVPQRKPAPVPLNPAFSYDEVPETNPLLNDDEKQEAPGMSPFVVGLAIGILVIGGYYAFKWINKSGKLEEVVEEGIEMTRY